RVPATAARTWPHFKEGNDMTFHRQRLAAVLLALLLPGASTCAVAAGPALRISTAERADSEASRTAPAAKVSWRAADPAAAPRARLRYGDLSARRIADMGTANAARDGHRPAPLQIGIGRSAAREQAGASRPALRWTAVPGGGQAATFEVTSPVAMGLRVGLKLEGLPAGAELRFLGSEWPLGDVLLATAKEIAASTVDGVYWTPPTDGETQTIEIYLPAGASPQALRVDAPELSHLLTNGRRDFKILEKIGESGTCNIDTACRVATLGSEFVAAKNAVAHMVFNLFRTNGTVYGTYICTGTLLNDTDPDTQVPLFYTANHCFAGGSGDVPAQDRQRVAATLSTHWNYEATACDSGVSTPQTTLTGGADLLFYEANTDAMLLRLRDPAPAMATFAGWDATVMAANSDVVAIHHPAGDAKKVSFGRQIPAASDGVNHGVGWLSGTTEGGSSGSGLFTVGVDGRYRLRGGLYGGNAACSNSGNLGNSQNRDWYSRLDVVFPQIRRYLMPLVRRNGGQPLAPR
nr:trypsin-like peptidase domain-containing protein [Luteimonas sp.]